MCKSSHISLFYIKLSNIILHVFIGVGADNVMLVKYEQLVV